jgi:hypothetical protein
MQVTLLCLILLRVFTAYILLNDSLTLEQCWAEWQALTEN